MLSSINIYSDQKGEINKFLSSYYNTNLEIEDKLKWQKTYKNPIEMTDLIGVYVENSEDYKLNFWVCLDIDVYIRVSNKNADKLIRYIYQRYPS